MSDGSAGKPFRCRVSFDQRELVGARWWFQGQRLAASSAARREPPKSALGKIALACGIAGAIGLCAAGALGKCDPSPSGSTPGRVLSLDRKGADDATVSRQALEAQKSENWNVGSTETALDYPGACDVDATGARDAVAAVDDLATDLRPAQPSLAPWYVSTLFQSPALPANRDLRAGLRPIFSPSMDGAFGRGEAVRTLFEGGTAPRDVAIVADLPGPDAVAFAAGLAPRFDPVFAFDNWPHPRGVVPAHLTLAASVYYRRWFLAHRAAAGSPPVFVLDRNRLSPYTDDAGRFDNRYIAKLPPAAALSALGIKHILYVLPGGDPLRELDDLNEPFVALREAGIDVKALPLTDLAPPKDVPVVAATAGAPTTNRYHYGGHPMTHWWFWNHYGSRGIPSGVRATEPTSVSRGFAYEPARRPTLFTGIQGPPRGFGNVTFHSSSGSSDSSGRSGSFGRSSPSFSG